MRVKNPVLKGFNPDPSMIYVDGSYYIATSTFEWYPGVQIHKSNDLVNWELAARPLNRKSLLELKGNPQSSGVWAPNLTHSNGLFYLVFSNVTNWDEPFKDVSNYITTCAKVDGIWSDPVYVNSSGFDPNLFHEEGRMFFLNMEWDFRKKGINKFSGILIQEWNPDKKKLIGEVKKIFKGTERGIVEGPNLYKIKDYYYLFCAEGGTDYGHAESVARSKNIFGPYELHPNKYIISSYKTNNPLQKAGHASICQNDEGKWYMAHLCGRYLPHVKVSPLGRETAIQEITINDGWPYLKNKTIEPSLFFETYNNTTLKRSNKKEYRFYNDSFLSDFQTLRIPFTKDRFIINPEEGLLKIIGKESIHSRFEQSIIARRVEDFSFNVQTTFDFSPNSFQEMAGLSYRYNEDNQYYFYATYNEIDKCRVLHLMTSKDKNVTISDENITFDNTSSITLGLEVRFGFGTFYYVLNEQKIYLKNNIDITILSDEYAEPMGFTGSFVGMLVIDMKNKSNYAEFSSFIYECIDDNYTI